MSIRRLGRGRAWGNALGGYKRQNRVGGKFASGFGGASRKVAGRVSDARTNAVNAGKRKLATSKANVSVGNMEYSFGLKSATVGRKLNYRLTPNYSLRFHASVGIHRTTETVLDRAEEKYRKQAYNKAESIIDKKVKNKTANSILKEAAHRKTRVGKYGVTPSEAPGVTVRSKAVPKKQRVRGTVPKGRRRGANASTISGQRPQRRKAARKKARR